MAEGVGPAGLGACDHCPSAPQSHHSVPTTPKPLHLIPCFLASCLSCPARLDPCTHQDPHRSPCSPKSLYNPRPKPILPHTNPSICPPATPGPHPPISTHPTPMHTPNHATTLMHTSTPRHHHTQPLHPAHAPTLTPQMLTTHPEPHTCHAPPSPMQPPQAAPGPPGCPCPPSPPAPGSSSPRAMRMKCRLFSVSLSVSMAMPPAPRCMGSDEVRMAPNVSVREEGA